MENNYIFTELDNLLNKIKFNPINESTIDDDDLDEIEPSEFETEEQARDAARKKVLSKLKSQETTPKAGTKAKMEMDIDDSIGGDAKSKSSGNSEDKTFHENALDDEFDDNFEWDDDDFDGEEEEIPRYKNSVAQNLEAAKQIQHKIDISFRKISKNSFDKYAHELEGKNTYFTNTKIPEVNSKDLADDKLNSIKKFSVSALVEL